MMKQTTLTGLSLTLLMLLLVLSAAFLFLFQGRGALATEAATAQAQVDGLQETQLQIEGTLTSLAATGTAVTETLATSEAAQIVLEGELVAKQQEIDALTRAVTVTVTAVPQATPTPTLPPPPAGPLVTIAAPPDGSIFAPGEVVTFVVAVYDPVGLATINVTVNGTGVSPYDEDVQGKQLFAVTDVFQEGEAGTYELSVTATNSNGVTGEPVSITIQVGEGGAAATETPTP